MFKSFVLQCKQSYSLSALATRYEILQSFSGRCYFKQPISSIFAKYGIQFFAMVDNVLYFTSNMEIYDGK